MHKIMKYQIFHLAGYALLTGFLYFFFHRSVSAGNFLGLRAGEWLALSWVCAFLHQFWISMFWRLELYGGHISKKLGKGSFTLYRAGFILFGFIRLFSIIPFSYLTRGTLNINPHLSLGIIIFSTPFIVWALYSVIFYFGINRAFGADHFFVKYRNSSLELRGTFRFIPNSMYTVVLILLYHPGLLYLSLEGLIAGLIHHVFVWFHYFCTEKPDMKEIYGN